MGCSMRGSNSDWPELSPAGGRRRIGGVTVAADANRLATMCTDPRDGRRRDGGGVLAPGAGVNDDCAHRDVVGAGDVVQRGNVREGDDPDIAVRSTEPRPIDDDRTVSRTHDQHLAPGHGRPFDG